MNYRSFLGSIVLIDDDWGFHMVQDDVVEYNSARFSAIRAGPSFDSGAVGRVQHCAVGHSDTLDG